MTTSTLLLLEQLRRAYVVSRISLSDSEQHSTRPVFLRPTTHHAPTYRTDCPRLSQRNSFLLLSQNTALENGGPNSRSAWKIQDCFLQPCCLMGHFIFQPRPALSSTPAPLPTQCRAPIDLLAPCTSVADRASSGRVLPSFSELHGGADDSQVGNDQR